MSLALTILGCSLFFAADPPSADEQVRAAVERSLPFVDGRGEEVDRGEEVCDVPSGAVHGLGAKRGSRAGNGAESAEAK